MAADPRPRSGMTTGYPTELQDRVERYLTELPFPVEAGTERLAEAMRYSLLAGGKRIRPVLSLATAGALGRPHDDVLPMAAAVELVHTYSLIHDDLPAMDDDDLRRGRPTCHIAYGEDVAILAGDGMFAEALSLVLREQRGRPEQVLAALAELTGSTGLSGMVGGQYLDISAPSQADAVAVRRVHELKTGRLIGASVLCVLLLSDCVGPAAEPYRRFAAELGVLFQIVDDILDVVGASADLGKPQGSDERHGKLTYLSVFGLDRSRQLATESHEKARAALALADGATEHLARITDYVLTRSS